ncbi:hypothetical protein [Paracoccus rhizosphaerae]|uniref:Uncharacterized protein n=1 Tax=Paracoccus rhizosphaerae TaxID=1133347 RepID=A0ABV6CFD9_9RHOB|nr:hypothetical protein [Paracoccus rhizosphaerae]
MRLTTSLAHYQLPRTDVLPVRPAVPGGQSLTETAPQMAADTPERVLPPMAYKQWLKLLTGYEAGAQLAPNAPSAGDAVPGRTEL